MAWRSLSAELDRQILPDGGHISRNPQIAVDLLLDLLPLFILRVFALVLVAAAPMAFAETQNVKVSGSIDAYAFYRDNFNLVDNDPAYSPELEGHYLIARGLFITSFLVDDFLGDEGFFGAHSVIITSASSRTSLALAHRLRERGGMKVVGLTSASHTSFVAGTVGAVVTMAIGLGLMGMTYGPLGTVLSEMFPTAVRYTGSSLTFNLAGIFGASLAPYIATWLATNHGLPFVGYYLSAAALLSLAGLLLTQETKGTDLVQ